MKINYMMKMDMMNLHKEVKIKIQIGHQRVNHRMILI